MFGKLFMTIAVAAVLVGLVALREAKAQRRYDSRRTRRYLASPRAPQTYRVPLRNRCRTAPRYQWRGRAYGNYSTYPYGYYARPRKGAHTGYGFIMAPYPYFYAYPCR